jgi:hypothetical protein
MRPREVPERSPMASEGEPKDAHGRAKSMHRHSPNRLGSNHLRVPAPFLATLYVLASPLGLDCGGTPPLSAGETCLPVPKRPACGICALQKLPTPRKKGKRSRAKADRSSHITLSIRSIVSRYVKEPGPPPGWPTSILSLLTLLLMSNNEEAITVGAGMKTKRKRQELPESAILNQRQCGVFQWEA